ncbi:MAG: 2-oxoacid:acceptor oxidoreductase family protein [Methanomassiliicoccales archaeon]
MKTIEIRWHGRGGQGVVTANELLAGAALREDKFIKAFPEFGPERMGAPIRAFFRISDKPIKVHSQVYNPDYVVVIDPSLVGSVDLTGGLKEKGSIIANYAGTQEDLARELDDGWDIHTVNATKIAWEEVGRPIANTAMLGALVKVSELVSLQSVLDEIQTKFSAKFPDKVVQKNLNSIKRAYEEVN